MQKSLIQSNLRSVISLVDKLRDINLENYIKLPKIVAVGSQSSGKSSLIEQIVGLDFLPRGSGVVTRRPLQIRMVYQADIKSPQAVFEELPKQKFTDFKKVKETIQFLTDKVCGKNTNIVDKAIVLNVYSSNCPNLTVIDLPGLTRISLESQDQDILSVTKNMIKKYMVQENTIILCVIPANQDITNDEVLHLARQVDKGGERTIGCITKIDIMDRGTDARQTLLNKGEVPLRLGYIGIKNRSQADINENKTVQQSLELEKMFFSKSPIYSSLPPSCMGTSSLVDKLTKVLENSITNYLPTLLQKIKQKKSTLSELVKSYGRPLPKTIEQRQSLIWEICNQYISQYRNAITGLVSIRSNADRVHKVSANINLQMRQFLAEQSNENFEEQLKDTRIQLALKKYDTINQLGFPSMNSFLFLINPLLNKLRLPMEESLNKICDSMTHLSDLVTSDIAHEYIGFRQYLNSVNLDIINEFKKKCNDYLGFLLESEIKGVSYQKLDFSYNRDGAKADKLTEIEKKNPLIPVLRRSIVIYYNNCVRNLRELIPKNFAYLILNEAVKKLQFQVFQSCMGAPQQVEKWLELSSYSKKERLNNEHAFETIVKAEQYILTHSGFSAIRVQKVSKRRSMREQELKQVMEKEKEKKQKKLEKMKQQKHESPVKAEETPKKTQGGQAGDGGPQSSSNSKSIFGDFGFGQSTQPKQPKPNQQKSQQKLQPTPSNNNSSKQQQPKPKQAKKNTMFQQLFGDTSKSGNSQSTQPSKQQSKGETTRKPIFENGQKNQKPKDIYNREAGKATDKAVDQMFKNQTFQKESKKAVQKGASTAFQKQFGVSEETGNMFGQGAGKLWGNEKTQNFAKQQSKKQARNKTQW